MEALVVLGLLAAFALWGYVSGEQSKVRRAQSETNQAKERLEMFRHQYECLSELVQKKLDGSIQRKMAEVEQRRREIDQECGNIREEALKSAEKEGEQIRSAAWKAAQKIQEDADEYAASIKNGSNEKVFLLKERLAKLKEQLQTLEKQPQTVTIRWIASQFSEFLDASAKETIRLLTHRKHPALKSAEVVRDEVAKRKEAERLAREYRLRCEYIEQLFPFLADVIDPGEDSLVEQEFWDGERPWEEVEDESARWLTQSEFEQLSSAEKEQLALDRYLARKKKSRWEVGMEYEDFVGYEFERDGFQVEYVGMAEGLKDMGRDLICQKGHKVFVVQCKTGVRKRFCTRNISASFLERRLNTPWRMVARWRNGARRKQQSASCPKQLSSPCS